MTTHGKTTTAVRATLGPKMMRNAPKFFGNSLREIIAELTQNSRRAGARAITFGFEGDDIVVDDDGPGLAREDVAVLLTLGGSANANGIDEREDAAGMGFFALANHDVIVESRDWILDIPRAAFSGEKDAILRTSPGVRTGMRIRIASARPKDKIAKDFRKDVALTAKEETLYSGLICIVRGENPSEPQVMETHQPRSFLARLDKVASASIEGTHAGLRIKIVRVRGDAKPHEVNFFGQVVSGERCQAIRDILEGFPRTESVGYRSGKNIYESTTRTIVLVDVDDTSGLKLTLPDRRGVVDDAAFAAVRATVRRLTLELLGRPDVPNGIAHDDPIRKMEPTIPAPTLRITAVSGGSDLLTGPDGHGGLRIEDQEQAAIDPASIVATFLDNGVIAMLETSDEPLQLHDWGGVYRAMGSGCRHVTHISVVATASGEEIETDKAEDVDEIFANNDDAIEAIESLDGFEENGGSIVDTLHLRLWIEVRGNPSEKIDVPVRLVTWDEACEPKLLLTKGCSDWEAVDVLMKTHESTLQTNPNENWEEEARRRFEEIVARIAGSVEETATAHLKEAISEAISRFLEATGRKSASFAIKGQLYQYPEITVT